MTDNITTLIADSREWVQLHRENKYQREAAKRMAGVLDALEAEHKRAEEATFVSKRVYTDVLAERDCYRAAIEEAHSVATRYSRDCNEVIRRILTRALNEGKTE